MGLARLAAVAALLALQARDGVAKKVRKKIVECKGRAPPPSDTFDVRVVQSIDADVCDRKSAVGDTLTVKFAAMYYDTCEEFQENKGSEFVLGAEDVLTGWNRGLVGMCEGEVRKLYLSTHELLSPSWAPRSLFFVSPRTRERARVAGRRTGKKRIRRRSPRSRRSSPAPAFSPPAPHRQPRRRRATSTRAVIMTVELQEVHRRPPRKEAKAEL